MGHCEDGFGTKVCIAPGVTVSDNYDRMQNKPRINGIELIYIFTKSERCAFRGINKMEMV